MFAFLRSLFSRRGGDSARHAGQKIPGYAIKTLNGSIPNTGNQPVSGIRPAVERSDWLPPKGWKPPAQSAQAGQMPALVLACFGDAAKAERLVRYELQRQPALSRPAAVLAALSRLEADRK